MDLMRVWKTENGGVSWTVLHGDHSYGQTLAVAPDARDVTNEELLDLALLNATDTLRELKQRNPR